MRRYVEGRLVEERGDKADLLAEKEALLERLHRLNGMGLHWYTFRLNLSSSVLRVTQLHS